MAKRSVAEVQVFAPGARVGIGPGAAITAEVLEISICGPERCVRYKLAWWEGRTRRAEWLESSEVAEVPRSARVGIGFRGDGENGRCV